MRSPDRSADPGAKLALQIERLIAWGGWDVKDEIAWGKFRRRRTDGLGGRRGGKREDQRDPDDHQL